MMNRKITGAKSVKPFGPQTTPCFRSSPSNAVRTSALQSAVQKRPEQHQQGRRSGGASETPAVCTAPRLVKLIGPDSQESQP